MPRPYLNICYRGRPVTRQEINAKRNRRAINKPVMRNQCRASNIPYTLLIRLWGHSYTTVVRIDC